MKLTSTEMSKTIPKDKNTFPKLMKCKDFIGLMRWESYGYYSGVVVHCFTQRYPIGHTSNIWNPLAFKDYFGTVTLTQKENDNDEE